MYDKKTKKGNTTMKKLILAVLEDLSKDQNHQMNLGSVAARTTIANTIMAAIKTKGWFLDLSTLDGKLKHLD